MDALHQIHLRLRSSDDPGVELGSLLGCEDRVVGRVHAVLETHPDAGENPDVRDSVGTLQLVFTILDTRARELLDRVHAPGEWKDDNIEQLTANFTKVLAAIEKNSKGRYRIVHNVAEQERQDYMVNFASRPNGILGGCCDSRGPSRRECRCP